MDRILPWIKARENQIVDLLKEMVLCESPSEDAAAVNRFVDLLAAKAPACSRIKTYPGKRFGRNVLIEFSLPGPRKRLPGRVLAVGHSDTVWPAGTLGTMPFRERNGRLWGPGVLDMKAGLAFYLTAVRALQELELPVARRAALWVVSDEEVGSEVSRPLTERLARSSSAVLVLEPGTGLEGKLKTARKGVGDYTIEVEGRASHAGVDFAAGASAVLELARQILKVSEWTDLRAGVTVNPGVIRGGTRTNVVAASARAEVDIRVAAWKDAASLERRFRALKPFDKRCRLQVTGGLNRPPMERTAGVAILYETASNLAARYLGIQLEESSTGGGSDGNFTAALGVPTLDGLGGVGEGAHASHESILKDRIADRTALLALLTYHLGQ